LNTYRNNPNTTRNYTVDSKTVKVCQETSKWYAVRITRSGY